MTGQGAANSATAIALTVNRDERGTLVVGEVPLSLPFVAARFFYVAGVPQSSRRGLHAHKMCHQFLVCVSGSLTAVVDDGSSSREFRLTQGDYGLYMPPLTWGGQFDFTADAVLLVLASHPYDQNDYIHSYDEFLSVRDAEIKSERITS